ncbi:MULTISPECIES: phosphopantetheine-binding protein [Nonomuraea]|uniref:acyl carrier protein n=1 Tax=Nonomuraea TaxID=83681 RepID=UPI001C5D0119|nr:phosphopantetheine-binding protein [Nonomuraea ceibae]
MSDDEIETVVRNTCAQVLKTDPRLITAQARLREDLDADSLDLAEIHVALEEVWGPIPRETLADVRTVADVLDQARHLAGERA